MTLREYIPFWQETYDMAPFREFLALVILDGDFDLPQHLSVDPAHRRAQLGGGFRGVEIKDAQEILMLEAVVRFKPQRDMSE